MVLLFFSENKHTCVAMWCARYTRAREPERPDRQTERQSDRQADRQTGRQTGRRTGRQTDRQTDGQITDRQAEQQRTQADERLSVVHTFFLVMHHAKFRFRYVRKKRPLGCSRLLQAPPPNPPMFNVALSWGGALAGAK